MGHLGAGARAGLPMPGAPSHTCPAYRPGVPLTAAVWREGRRLPSEAELAGQYGVARITVRSAIAMLRDAGKPVTVHGRGSFTSP